jgi:hypothetical protein
LRLDGELESVASRRWLLAKRASGDLDVLLLERAYDVAGRELIS